MKTIVAFIAGLIAAPVLIALAAIAGRLPTNSTTSPSKWESSIGMRALDASLEARSKGHQNPYANDKTALVAGAKLYQHHCSGCHGDAKGPSSWGNSDLYPRAPQFFQEGSDVTPAEAHAAIHDGIRYSAMGAWGDQIADSDIWKLANFIGSIRAPSGKKMSMGHD